MIITIHQPEHLPWLGLFNKISKAETFVILDNVQFEKNYFQNRNRIMGTNGVQWINVPTCTKGHLDSDLANTEISYLGKNAKWRDTYLKTIQMSYGKYPFFQEVFSILEDAIRMETDLLCDINISIIKGFANKLDIHPKYVRSSDLNVDGSKSELILDICKSVGATVYIAGPSGRDYLDVNSFEESGITIKYNDYVHPTYPQRKSKDFETNLSILDLLMNVGFTEGKTILMYGNEGLSD